MTESTAMPPEELRTALRGTRRRTLALVGGLTDAQLDVPPGDWVNPLVWELGHVAFFYDAFVRGHLDGVPPLRERAEEFYDSFDVHHHERWGLPLPARAEVLGYLQEVAEDLEGRLDRHCLEGRAYPYRLALRHEDMHNEAHVMMRALLGYPDPVPDPKPAIEAGPWPGDVEVAGGRYFVGAEPGGGAFVFDNEKWAHAVDLETFRIAKAPVTQAEFAEFVEDGGYERPELWGRQGRVWRERHGVVLPHGWSRAEDGAWQRRHFDGVCPLAPHQPMCQVSWHEAQAYCTWAGRRLPTEEEWEVAARVEPASGAYRAYPWGGAAESCANLDLVRSAPVDVAAFPEGDSAVGCRQMAGNVWEWTASAFYPFVGYLVDDAVPGVLRALVRARAWCCGAGRSRPGAPPGPTTPTATSSSPNAATCSPASGPAPKGSDPCLSKNGCGVVGGASEPRNRAAIRQEGDAPHRRRWGLTPSFSCHSLAAGK